MCRHRLGAPQPGCSREQARVAQHSSAQGCTHPPAPCGNHTTPARCRHSYEASTMTMSSRSAFGALLLAALVAPVACSVILQVRPVVSGGAQTQCRRAEARASFAPGAQAAVRPSKATVHGPGWPWGGMRPAAAWRKHRLCAGSAAASVARPLPAAALTRWAAHAVNGPLSIACRPGTSASRRPRCPPTLAPVRIPACCLRRLRTRQRLQCAPSVGRSRLPASPPRLLRCPPRPAHGRDPAPGRVWPAGGG